MLRLILRLIFRPPATSTRRSVRVVERERRPGPDDPMRLAAAWEEFFGG